MSDPVPEISDELQEQDPVVITASINDGVDPDLVSVPRTVDEIVESVVRCHEEGAAIAHLHGLYTREDGEIEFDISAWGEIHDRIREECDIITQLGLTVGPDGQRIALLEEANAAPDMLSITLNHNDHHRKGHDEMVTHTRDEMIRLAEVCTDYGIEPELEIFHSGSVWNLNYMIEQCALEPPYWCNLPFGMLGGVWCPGIPEQLDARRALLPEEARWHVCYFAGQKGSAEPDYQRRFHAYALTVGGNVRIGIEENADYRTEPPEEAAATLVGEIADLSELLHRGVATPDEGRDLLGIST